ncbi:retropepsin-like aspartic protease family protein [Planktothrix mougeotii]|uniref:Retroviral-like aspartic protease family protein n=1 Tax=Planktothrix mougeotii LEGE 06226 TaxID=1828728 RepID=A0ABR9U8D0_9CYAN|nr:retropepsin-like aspartic protease [Planktothrix mougeotii]MBE9142451.1 retroviral-like aspartic protease family protein [Planktothrix mougeotii LEGE 06226]
MNTSPSLVRSHPLSAFATLWLYYLKVLAEQAQRHGLSRLIPLFSILLSTTGFILSDPLGAIAQEYPGCFMKTKTGQMLSLNQVCIFPQTDAKTAISPLATPGIYQAKIVRRDGGIPVIQVVFNGQQPFEMMVDTGASGTVITPLMAELLGVIPSGRGKADTPSQKNVEFDLGTIQKLEVAGAIKNNLTVAIAPTLDVGLLGQDFFGEYDVTIKADIVEFRARQ